MRLRHPDGSLLHLAYCSNVHPADDLDGVAAQLERYAARVRERARRAACSASGCGWRRRRWPTRRRPERLREQLDRLGLEVVTLNGFPYTAFHAPVVKLEVYRPNWAADARRDYTLALARLLAALLPDDVDEGSISTLPLGWRTEWGDADAAAGPARARGGRGRARRAGGGDRQADPDRARARAGLHDRDRRAGGGRSSPGSRPSGSACAWTPATSRCSSRRADGALALLARRRRAGRQGAGVERAARARAGRRRRPRVPRRLRRAALPAPGARVRRRRASPAPTTCPRRWTAGCPRESEWRVHFHVPVHARRAHDAGRARGDARRAVRRARRR